VCVHLVDVVAERIPVEVLHQVRTLGALKPATVPGAVADVPRVAAALTKCVERRMVFVQRLEDGLM